MLKKSKNTIKSIDKVKKDYNKIAPLFNITRQYSWAEFSFFTPYIKENVSIADIGCGTGRMYKFLKNLKIPFEYIGIDISKRQLEEAKKQFIKAKFLEGNMTHLEFRDNQFDLVFMVASLHHLSSNKDRLKTLKEVYRISKNDSFIFITNWNLHQKRFWKYWISNFFRFLKTFGKFKTKDFFIPWKNSDKKVMANRYYYGFSKREIKKLAKKAGFEILKNIYTKGNKKSTLFSAHNIVTILKK